MPLPQADDAGSRTRLVPTAEGSDSPLFVRSVEKAIRVLDVFDARRPCLSLSQIAAQAGLDMSAAQRSCSR